MRIANLSPVHLVLQLILALYFFFKNAIKIASGGLTQSLGKIGFFQKNIYVVKNTSS